MKAIIYAILTGMLAAGIVAGLAAKPVVSHLQLDSYGPPATTLSAISHATPQDDIFPWIGCCDVYIYTPILRSESLTSEGDIRIEFAMRIYTNVTPQSFLMTIELKKYRGPFRKAEIIDSEIITKHDLPREGRSRQERWEFYCQPGRYYVEAKILGTPRGGTHSQFEKYFFPWRGFRKHDLKKGDQNRIPTANEMWRTKCEGHDDTLTG